MVGWLFGWDLWHINLSGEFNNPFLYKSSVLFQTIQFSMSRQFICENITTSSYSV